MIIRGRAVTVQSRGSAGTLCLVLSRFVTRTEPTGTVPPEGPSSTGTGAQAAPAGSRLGLSTFRRGPPGTESGCAYYSASSGERSRPQTTHRTRGTSRGKTRAASVQTPASYRTCTHVHRSPGESRSDCRPVSPHANRTPSRPEPPTPRVPSCEPSALSPSAYPPPFLSAFASAAPVCSAPFSHIGPPSARWKYA